MRKIAWLVLAAGLSAFSGSAAAVPLRGMYDATVPVADQSPKLREPALRRALEIVMMRVTGDRNFAAGPGAPLLDRASSLLQGYGYEAAGQALQLKVQFDPKAVDGALRQSGLVVWGVNRLVHQLWIAMRDDGQAAAVLDAAGVAARAGALLPAADQRGIPLSYPAMDATDRKMVNFRALWEGDFTGVRGAARRHNPDVVVVVRVGREGNAWLSRWSVLKDDGPDEQWSRLLPTLEQALAEGLHELADRQARRFAVQTGSQQDVRLEVSGVNSVEDYSRVLNYLRKLNPVRAAFVDEVGAGQVRFRLQVEGDPQLLPRVIASGALLRPDGGGSPRDLRYVLVR